MDADAEDILRTFLRKLLDTTHKDLLAHAEAEIDKVLAAPPTRRPHFDFVKDGQPIESVKAQLVTEIIAIYRHPLWDDRHKDEADKLRGICLALACVIDDYVTQLYEPKKFPPKPPKPPTSTLTPEQQEELKGKVQ
jgi:hypothetical protein